MKNISVEISILSQPSAYNIVIGKDLLADAGKWARRCLGPTARRVVVISNKTVYQLYGEKVMSGVVNAGFEAHPYLIGDGERFKSWRTAEKALGFLSEVGVTRTDAVIALGGGVVGDLAGFVSAIHLRGVLFLQVPTTLLAMIDSSVGGKTGVNTVSGKNLIGAFHQPHGVLIDTETLCTLPVRQMAAGAFEAVKHAAIGGHHLLKPVSDFLKLYPLANTSSYLHETGFHQQISRLIAGQVEFKSIIVSGDERESSGREDTRSRKILNFGHTLAHALESATNYRRLLHGEAVGHGIIFAGELSKSLALCVESDVQLLNDVVHSVGPLPAVSDLDPAKIRKNFDLDKKHIAGELQMVLLKGIGQPVIVSEKKIPPTVLSRTLTSSLSRSS